MWNPFVVVVVVVVWALRRCRCCIWSRRPSLALGSSTSLCLESSSSLFEVVVWSRRSHCLASTSLFWGLRRRSRVVAVSGVAVGVVGVVGVGRAVGVLQVVAVRFVVVNQLVVVVGAAAAVVLACRSAVSDASPSAAPSLARVLTALATESTRGGGQAAVWRLLGMTTTTVRVLRLLCNHHFDAFSLLVRLLIPCCLARLLAFLDVFVNVFIKSFRGFHPSVVALSLALLLRALFSQSCPPSRCSALDK